MLIQIRRYQFELLGPYAEGHRLTAGEAQALNSLRAENIRNAVAKTVHDAMQREGETLSPETLSRIREEIAKRDREYEFKPRPQMDSPRPGTIEFELASLIGERIAEAARQGTPLTEEAREALSRDKDLYDLARKRIEITAAVARQALESLL